MSEYISKEEINRVLLNRIDMNNKCLIGARESKHFEEEKYFSTLIFEDEQIKALIEESTPSADARENIHGHWERMSDLPEDKDDRYKCSRCGNVVHHSNGVNLYTFNSWCGKCGSLNNSLIAGLEPKGEKPNAND